MAIDTRFTEHFSQYCSSDQSSASVEDGLRLFTDDTQIQLNEQLTQPGTPKPIVVYLDPTMIESSNIYLSICNMEVFANRRSCREYITSIIDNRIFLLTVNSLAKKIIPSIYNQSNVAFIYVYHDTEIQNTTEDKWISKYLYLPKILGIYQNRNTAFNRSFRDIFTASVNFRSIMTNSMQFVGNAIADIYTVSSCPINSNNNNNNDQGYKNIPYDLPYVTICNLSKATQQSIHDFNKDDASFMWFQLLIEVLYRIPQTDLSKKQLLDIARQNYETDDCELKKILDFEMNYSASEAIKWYTKDSFIYRLLNAALRTKNIDHIFLFRTIITDVINQLKQLHEDFIQILSKDTQCFTVYKGQMMNVVDLEKLKTSIGSAISWNCFVSTNEDPEVALKLAGCDQGQPDEKLVLFEIELDKRLSTTINTVGNLFANITAYSEKKDENEILLSIGSIFRIESIRKHKSVWHVKLVMIEEEINELMSHYLRELEGKTNVSKLGSLLAKIDDYDRAINYKHFLLDHYLSKNEDQITIALLYNNLAISYNEKGNITKAFDYCQRSLTLLTDELPPDDTIFFSIFNNLGIVHLQRAEYTNAIEMFSKALILTKNDVCKRIIVHVHLATTYSEQGNMINMDAHLTKSLSLLSTNIEILKTHPMYGRIYNMLGTVYVHKNEFAKAQEFFEHARSIEATLSAKDHSSIGVKLNNMAVVLGQNGDYNLALKKARDALQSLSIESIERATVFNNLGVIYRSMGEYQMALDAYHEALQVDFKYKSSDHPSFSIRYLNIGCVHFVMLDFDLARDMLQKSLNIALKSSKVNNSKLIGSIYRTLGTVYLVLGNQIQGEDDIKKAFDIDPIMYEKYSNPLTPAYRTLANIFEINKRDELAQYWNKKALSTQITQANLG